MGQVNEIKLGSKSLETTLEAAIITTFRNKLRYTNIHCYLSLSSQGIDSDVCTNRYVKFIAVSAIFTFLSGSFPTYGSSVETGYSA